MVHSQQQVISRGSVKRSTLLSPTAHKTTTRGSNRGAEAKNKKSRSTYLDLQCRKSC